MQPSDDVERSEIEALAATRAELGPEYDAALLASFADRVERAIDVRVGQVLGMQSRSGELERTRSHQQLTLGIISAVAGIPISIVLGLKGNEVALLIAWVGIVAVNFAHAFYATRAREVRRGR
jgi:hypothetical protein